MKELFYCIISERKKNKKMFDSCFGQSHRASVIAIFLLHTDANVYSVKTYCYIYTWQTYAKRKMSPQEKPMDMLQNTSVHTMAPFYMVVFSSVFCMGICHLQLGVGWKHGRGINLCIILLCSVGSIPSCTLCTEPVQLLSTKPYSLSALPHRHH